MLMLIFFGFAGFFGIAQSTLPYSFQHMQKVNLQRCMQCPEIYVNQICGFIDDEHAVGSAVVAEKKPVPCGVHNIHYDIYWSNKICAKAQISCSTNQYQYAYTYTEGYSDAVDSFSTGMAVNKTMNNGIPKITTNFFDFGKNSTWGLFFCNENGQWEHANRDDYWFPDSKRIQIPQNISCLFSNLAIMGHD